MLSLEALLVAVACRGAGYRGRHQQSRLLASQDMTAQPLRDEFGVGGTRTNESAEKKGGKCNTKRHG